MTGSEEGSAEMRLRRSKGWITQGWKGNGWPSRCGLSRCSAARERKAACVNGGVNRGASGAWCPEPLKAAYLWKGERIVIRGKLWG